MLVGKECKALRNTNMADSKSIYLFFDSTFLWNNLIYNSLSTEESISLRWDGLYRQNGKQILWS